MTYSSALVRRAGATTCADAQRRKIDGCSTGRRRAGQHVLEIGTGWGALAIRAAQRGARVTTLTISAEQASLAEERLRRGGRRRPGPGAAARLPRGAGQLRRGRQRRDDRGGRRAVLADVLRHARPAAQPGRPGRAAGDHDAARPDAGLARRLHLDPQVRLPRRADPVGAAIEQTWPPHTGLRVVRAAQPRRRLRAHAARTGGEQLPSAAGTEVAALGFDETFRRMWEFYLAYCEAGFRVGYLDVLPVRRWRAAESPTRRRST